MKYFVLCAMIGFGIYSYVSQDSSSSLTGDKKESEAVIDPLDEAPVHPQEVAAELPEPEQPRKQVHILGKWYDYRADNTYMIDGVPTLFIPQKNSAPAVEKMDEKNEAHEKSEALLKVATGNPLDVYTTKGAKTLRDTLGAIKNSNEKRGQVLEKYSK